MSKVRISMSKVKDFQRNFWKRGVTRAVVTILGNGFECKIELYSLNKSFLGSRVIPYYQLKEELKSLGFKRLELLEE